MGRDVGGALNRVVAERHDDVASAYPRPLSRRPGANPPHVSACSRRLSPSGKDFGGIGDRCSERRPGGTGSAEQRFEPVTVKANNHLVIDDDHGHSPLPGPLNHLPGRSWIARNVSLDIGNAFT